MRSLIMLAMLFSMPVFAEIYRWVDDQGHVHFSARPQDGAVPVEVSPQVIARDEPTLERQARTERFFEARREERQAFDQRASEQRARQERECGQLRSQLSRLANGGRYFRTDANGERVYYSEDEVKAVRQQLSNRINRYCS